MAAANGVTRPIRLGIIGTGPAVEHLHWPALRQLPEQFRIVAFAAAARPSAECFAAYSGASMRDYHAEYADLPRGDDVEAVPIALPIPLNSPVTRACLEAGKDVICEKPAGVDLAQGREFVDLVGQYPERTALLAENVFYRDDLRLARSLLDDGAIGRLHLLAWRQVSRLVPRTGTFSGTPWRHDPRHRGGPHLDAGVHNIAQLRLLGGAVARVHGEVQDANATHGGPSDLTLTVRFASGAIGSYTAAYPDLAMPPEPNELHLYGDAAAMTLAGRSVQVHRPDGVVEDYRVEGTDGGYANEFRDFYDAARHDAPLVGTVAQTVRTMQVVLGGLDAAETGRVPVIEDWPGGLSAASVPLWRPHGAAGLFDGLPCRIAHETRQWSSLS